MTSYSQAGLSQAPTTSGITRRTFTAQTPVPDTGPSLWPPFLAGQIDKPIRVLLIDDDAHIRQVISHELLKDLRTDLVAQGSGMRDGRRLISRHEFDVMLVDLHLDDGSGFELIEHMKAMRPMTEAIVISALEDEQLALRAFELGATGYLVKNSWFGNFPQAVLQVVNGGAAISPSLARRLLQRLDRPKDPTHGHGHGHGHASESKNMLSEREKGVLKMVSAGYTSSEIASQLLISSHTVNTHIKNIYRKLHVRSRAQAVGYAAHRGLL